MSRLAAIVALLGFAAAAPAAIVMTGNTEAEATLLPTGETQYTLTLTADPGWVVAGADADASGLGIEGNTVQVWLLGGAMTTPTLDTADFLGAADKAKDTHWLLYNGDLTIPSGHTPSETAKALTGAFSLAPSIRENSLDLLQIGVTEYCKYVDYAIKVSQYKDGVSLSQDFTGRLHGIPEPGTLALLGLGGLAALRRRRRS